MEGLLAASLNNSQVQPSLWAADVLDMPVNASERAFWEMRFFAGLRVEEWNGMCECLD